MLIVFFMIQEIIAGGIAGATAKTAVAPLERVKIMFQTGSAANRSILDVLGNIVSVEGFKGMWKGNGASVLRVVPYASLHFTAYERFRASMKPIRQHPTLGFLGRTPTVDLLAGSAAGATAVLVTYPLDLLRTRLAWRASGISSASGQAGMVSTLTGVVVKDGVYGLYRGIGPSLLGILPYAGLKFFVYQSLKKLYLPQSNISMKDAHVPTYIKLTCGGIAGLIAQTVTYPLDVVRRRMQVQDLHLDSATHMETIRNSWHGLKVISKLGVRRGLYAGLSINYLKVVPSTAIGFAVYDTMKEVLQHKTSI